MKYSILLLTLPNIFKAFTAQFYISHDISSHGDLHFYDVIFKEQNWAYNFISE